MKRFIIIVTILVLTIGFHSLNFTLNASGSNEIFISNLGNDITGDGSISNPYYSLDHVTSVVSPGDIIYFRGGTYQYTDKSDNEIWGLNGTEANPITITNYNDEIVNIDARNVSNFSSNGDAVMKFDNSSFVNISNININGGHSYTGVRSRGIQLGSTSSNIIVSDITVTNTYYKGVGLSGTDLIFENSEVFNTSRDNVNKIAGSSGWEQAVSTYLGANNIIIRNNYVHENWGEGIDVILGENVQIQGNILHDNYSANIYVDTGKNVTIERNYIYRTSSTFDRYDGQRSNSILLANENNNPTYFIDNIVIRNNILGLGNKRGIGYFQMNGTYSNVRILNNIIYNPFAEAIWFENTSSSTGNKLKNNIIYNGSSLIDIDTSNRTSWSFSNNSWQNGTPPLWASSINDENTEPNFESATISIPSSILKPYYPLQESNQFLLKDVSPMIDAGISDPDITEDYNTVSRDSSPDIGIFEYVNINANITIDNKITNDQTPVITGTIDNNTVNIEIEISSNIYNATVNTDGTWIINDNIISALPEGTYDIIARVYHNSNLIALDSTSNELIIDTTKPEISLNGENYVRVLDSIGFDSTDPGAIWNDNFDGSGVATIGGESITPGKTPGEYIKRYNYTDMAGNTANEVTRTVRVYSDKSWSEAWGGEFRDTQIPDVPYSHIFAASIYNLNEINVINGYLDGYFRPNKNVTRGQMAVFIARGFELPVDNSCADFSDVKSQYIFYESITTLKCLGIIDGYLDGSYKPNNTVSRGAAMKYIINASRLKETGDKNDDSFLPINNNLSFSDIPTNHIFYPFIMAGASNNVISGYLDGTFKSDRNVSRGALAKMVYGVRNQVTVITSEQVATDSFSDSSPNYSLNFNYPTVFGNTEEYDYNGNASFSLSGNSLVVGFDNSEITMGFESDHQDLSGLYDEYTTLSTLNGDTITMTLFRSPSKSSSYILGYGTIGGKDYNIITRDFPTELEDVYKEWVRIIVESTDASVDY